MGIIHKDKIDEWLYNNLGVIPGCCSSIESLKYDVAREVVEKLQEDLIKRSKEWLGTHIISPYQSKYLDKFEKDIKL